METCGTPASHHTRASTGSGRASMFTVMTHGRASTRAVASACSSSAWLAARNAAQPSASAAFVVHRDDVARQTPRRVAAAELVAKLHPGRRQLQSADALEAAVDDH